MEGGVVVDRHWLYAGQHVMAELDGSLQKRMQYVYDQGLDRPVAALGGAGVTGGYHLLDELGNVAGQRTKAAHAQAHPAERHLEQGTPFA